MPLPRVLFNSLTFVVFFALVLGGYWTLRSWGARKNLLLVASYVFYGAWNPPFVLAARALDQSSTTWPAPGWRPPATRRNAASGWW
jgi:hypothetical protein